MPSKGSKGRFERSANMVANKSSNTSPEVRVRRALHHLGLRFRLHDKRFPGRPDIVLALRKLVIYVHGCFWHQHGCGLSSVPRKRTEYWLPKLTTTVTRDAKHLASVQAQGWQPLVIWECDTRSPVKLDAFARKVKDLPAIAPSKTAGRKGS
jgi:DNA mismatch endonuclease (patch repair protein)